MKLVKKDAIIRDEDENIVFHKSIVTKNAKPLH